ncbi:MAG: serine/threonine protein kinase, partial [Blautia sp.]|nr:serine/threonine protein kinase [Blautia sp.]
MSETNNIVLPPSWKEWQILEPLGHGAFGAVYKAAKNYEGGNAPIYSAIKVIRIPENDEEYKNKLDELGSENSAEQYFQSLAESCTREIRLMDDLKGITNIVSVQDCEVEHNPGTSKWTIYIRMELLTSFDEYRRTHTIDEEEVIRMGIDICSALEYCEKINVMHRDIKPENILVSSLGNFKLGDFGVARKLESAGSLPSIKVGTYDYMAPEVYRGGFYDNRADIYSLGLVMYRLLNNYRGPFLPADQQIIRPDMFAQARFKRFGGEPVPAPAMASKAMAKIIKKAVAYDMEDRYKSAGEMKKDLLKITGSHFSLSARRTNKGKSEESNRGGFPADSYPGTSGNYNPVNSDVTNPFTEWNTVRGSENTPRITPDITRGARSGQGYDSEAVHSGQGYNPGAGWPAGNPGTQSQRNMSTQGAPLMGPSMPPQREYQADTNPKKGSKISVILVPLIAVVALIAGWLLFFGALKKPEEVHNTAGVVAEAKKNDNTEDETAAADTDKTDRESEETEASGNASASDNENIEEEGESTVEETTSEASMASAEEAEKAEGTPAGEAGTGTSEASAGKASETSSDAGGGTATGTEPAEVTTGTATGTESAEAATGTTSGTESAEATAGTVTETGAAEGVSGITAEATQSADTTGTAATETAAAEPGTETPVATQTDETVTLQPLDTGETSAAEPVAVAEPAAQAAATGGWEKGSNSWQDITFTVERTGDTTARLTVYSLDESGKTK